MGDLNPEKSDHDGEEEANQRPESRSNDHSQPIRGQEKDKDIDLRIKELEGVIFLRN